jgi:hypothetical protein
MRFHRIDDKWKEEHSGNGEDEALSNDDARMSFINYA